MKNLIFFILVALAVMVWLCPIYLAINQNGWLFLLMLVSWIPALLVGKVAVSIDDSINKVNEQGRNKGQWRNEIRNNKN